MQQKKTRKDRAKYEQKEMQKMQENPCLYLDRVHQQ